MRFNRKQSHDDNSLMEVDKEPTAGPSTSPWRIHQQTSSVMFVAGQASQYACKKLASIISHDDPNDDIREPLGAVFNFVHNLLFQRSGTPWASCEPERISK